MTLRSSIVDASQTRVSGANALVKVLTWFDNEWAYANRMLDVANHWSTICEKRGLTRNESLAVELMAGPGAGWASGCLIREDLNVPIKDGAVSSQMPASGRRCRPY